MWSNHRSFGVHRLFADFNSTIIRVGEEGLPSYTMERCNVGSSMLIASQDAAKSITYCQGVA